MPANEKVVNTEYPDQTAQTCLSENSGSLLYLAVQLVLNASMQRGLRDEIEKYLPLAVVSCEIITCIRYSFQRILS